MEELITIIVIGIAALIVALPIVALILAGFAYSRAKAAANSMQELLNCVTNLQKELLELKK